MTRREPFILEAGRSGRIRTCDPLVPNEVRYQTAPHSASASRRRYSRQNPGLQAPSSMQERSEKALCAAHAGCTSISMSVCSAAFRGPCLWARLLGRSQVVRQRILIPPFGGSNPPAPANKAALPKIRNADARKPSRLSRGFAAIVALWLRMRCSPNGYLELVWKYYKARRNAEIS